MHGHKLNALKLGPAPGYSKLTLALVVSLWIAPASRGASWLPALPNGIAAGDVTGTTAVLWARSTNAGPVTFSYSTNANFSPALGTITTHVTNGAVPVKAEANGLIPGTSYSYRVTDAVGNSLTGKFRTAADPGSFAGLRFGVSGDWRGELAPYPSVANAAARDLDFFVALGDTIYADVPSPAVPANQVKTLGQFRAKHSEVYSARFGLNALADLRSSTTIFAVIDDHEVANDFAGGAPVDSDVRFGQKGVFVNDSELFQTALQVFHEYNPLRSLRYDTAASARTHNKPKLYRSQQFGRDAAIFLLDARSFRDEGLPGVANPLNTNEVSAFNAFTFDVDSPTGQPLPRRTMLGLPQLSELKADLQAVETNGVVWKFVIVPEPIQNLGFARASDRFEGYAAERTDLLQHIAENEIRNVVFISADIHGTVVNNINYQLGPGQAHLPSGSFEIVTGPVAYDKPFGPTAFDFAETIQVFPGANLLQLLLSLVGVDNRNAFEALPRVQKDQLFQSITDFQLNAIGLDPTGLANSDIDATLLEGGYVMVHSYGWTEFEIDKVSQELTVTTYGIDAYSASQIDASITNRRPEVISRFVVRPQPLSLEKPRLTAVRVNGSLKLSWRTSATNYVLQSASGIGVPTEWVDANVIPILVGNQAMATVGIAGDSRFYRLQKW